MKQKLGRKWIVILLALCIVMLLGAFVLNNDFSTTSASADTTTSSIEDDLTFNLFNNGTEYKVTARNRQITYVKIPETYNDLPVTEIADNGFTNCTNLQYIWIPYTVKRIGNNAFTNCRNLERINGMPRVESIGNNAFAMCLKLDNLILPNSINTLGSTILRNNPNTVYSRMTHEKIVTLNPNWKASNDPVKVIYGDQIVLDSVIDENEELIGYSIGQSQCFSADIDVVIGDTFNGKPLLEIEQGAFYYNEFRSFTLQHGEIVLDIDATNNKNFEPNADECKHTVNIASEAFYGLQAEYIDLLVDVTFDDFTATIGSDFEVGYSHNVFAWSSVRKITIPNNIDIIPPSTFAYCDQLREICNTDPNVEVNHLSDKITSIGSEAFISCKSLLNLYVPSVKNMGSAVFSQWGDPKFNSLKQVINFEDLYVAPVGKDGYNWDSGWIGQQYENAKVQFKTLKVILEKGYEDDDDSVVENWTKSVDVMLKQGMPEEDVVAPQREYYTFEGYYSKRNGEGDQYYDKNMKSVHNWEIEGDGVLYAYWIGLPYEITFNKNGGEGGSDGVTANYMSPMPEASAPDRTGYRFTGYFYDPEGENTPYYDENMQSVRPWDKTQGAELVAGWVNKNYNVILKHEDITETVTATFDLPMPKANKPLSFGQTFNGYFTEEKGNGTPYYNADMSSASDWDIDQDNITLYACFTPTPYKLTFDMQGGEGGMEYYEPIHYKDTLPEASVPVRIGKTFKGYYTKIEGKGQPYYDEDMNPVVDYYDVDHDLTVYAYWIITDFILTFDNQDETGSMYSYGPIHYLDKLPKATKPIRPGYTFLGYYSQPKVEGEVESEGKKYYNPEMKAQYSYDVGENLTLYAHWEHTQHQIKFEKEGGEGGTAQYKPIYYDYHMPDDLIAPRKKGSEFKGYYTEKLGKGRQYFDAAMTPMVEKYDVDADLTLYAYLEEINYTITFEKEGGTGGTNNIYPINYKDPIPEAEAPEFPGHTFMGYYTEKRGGGKPYYDANMTPKVKEYLLEDNLTLYANWVETRYTLTFDKQDEEGGTDNYTPVYFNGSLPKATKPVWDGHNFLGYFDAPKVPEREDYLRYYNADMTPAFYYNVDDNLTVYAHWEEIEYNIIYIGIPDDINPNPKTYKLSDLPLNIVPVDVDGYRYVFDPNVIPEKTIGDIEVYTSPEAITYKITYDLNGGSDKGDNPDYYTVDVPVILNDAIDENMDFNGWTLDGKSIKNLNGLHRDITLKANWIKLRTIYITSGFTNLNITNKNVNIFFDVAFTGNCTITTSSNTKYLGISGGGRTYNLNIKINASTDFTLALSNIAIRAHSEEYAIKMNTAYALHLYTSGTVLIQGFTSGINDSDPLWPDAIVLGRDGQPAIYCGNLYIWQATTLIIKGGDGIDGGNSINGYGENGTNAAPAIVTTSDVYIVCNNVMIAGGVPGKGGNGLYYGFGGAGAYPVVGTTRKPTVYVLKDAVNVFLLKSNDGANGEGLNPISGGGIVIPTIPDPDPGIYIPPIGGTIDPGAGSGVGIPIIPQPTPPYRPI